MKVMVYLSKEQLNAILYSVSLFMVQLRGIGADPCIISNLSCIGDRVTSLWSECPEDSSRDLILSPFECGLVSEALQLGDKYKNVRFSIYPCIIEGMYKSPYFDEL